MGIGEQRAPRRESIDVGRMRLGMPAQAAHPVVEVVHGDQQYVGLLCGG